MRRKPWPSSRSLPRFGSEEQELAFWERHDVPWDDEAQWEGVPGPEIQAYGALADRPLPAPARARRGGVRYR
jgi:hypothetical protein